VESGDPSEKVAAIYRMSDMEQVRVSSQCTSSNRAAMFGFMHVCYPNMLAFCFVCTVHDSYILEHSIWVFLISSDSQMFCWRCGLPSVLVKMQSANHHRNVSSRRMSGIVWYFGVRPLLGIFAPEQPDRMWLCAPLTRAPKVVESCSKAQKTRHVF